MHRTVSAFDARGGCLAIYDAVSGRFDIVSHTRGQPEWPVPLFARALAEGRTAQIDGALAVPFSCANQPCGVLALTRTEPFARHERQALRGVCAKIGSELERRHDLTLDDVIDALLKKTKPAFEPLDINIIIHDTVSLIMPQISAKNKSVKFELDVEIVVLGTTVKAAVVFTW